MQLLKTPLATTEKYTAFVLCESDLGKEHADSISHRTNARDLFMYHATLPQQTHSVNVGIIERNQSGGVFPDTDALISLNPSVAVGVVTADCVPILIYAPDIEGIAAVHAGWRGTIAGIVDNVVKELVSRGASAAELQVIFGPSISADIYEVSDDLAQKFRAEGYEEFVTYPDLKSNKPHIDLQGVNVKRFIDLGVSEDNIRLSELFTDSALNEKGERLFPSYRCDGGTDHRLLTAISMF